jgi:hypothetical protein
MHDVSWSARADLQRGHECGRIAIDGVWLQYSMRAAA